MHKIGVIGDYETICGFASIGFDTAFVNSKNEAKEALRKMIKNNYSIIYMTPDFFCEANTNKAAIIPLPDKNNTLGTERIERFTEKAAGSKI